MSVCCQVKRKKKKNKQKKKVRESSEIEKKKCYCVNVCLCFFFFKWTHTHVHTLLSDSLKAANIQSCLYASRCFCVSVFCLFFFPRLLLQQCTETKATPVVLSVTVKWTADANRWRQEVWSYRRCLHPPHLNICTRTENKGRSTVSSFIFYDTSASSEMASLFCSNITTFFVVVVKLTVNLANE